jgi:hypothetical protein
VSELAPRQPGSPTPDEADRGGGPSAEVIARGYEEDGYDPKSVISVPILVVGFFVLAFTSVTIIFAYFRHPPANPTANPQTVEDNSKPLKDRIAGMPRGRPEPQQILDEKGGNALSITRPPAREGNPPLFHPEDIRPSPTNTPTLFRTVEGRGAHVPLPDAMAAALKDKKLPARANPTTPLTSSAAPSAANGGRGKPPAPPADPMKDEKKEEKKDGKPGEPAKKDEKKEGKK